ncbi:acyl carrier protein [Magnetospira sp. QH-2]|uniref:acyl carrier protein n=1 Tax=Magnetospira sp. (strain QH-2) TaxID=1288970 RepID=UPI0003E81B17|nr:acyl carrier protein [Magnetospira sp. QH-2]CCQ75515.1 putative Acyl carrier protein [Magnetospira sp. QH-2]
MKTTEKIIELVKEVCYPEEPNLTDLDKSLLECGLDSLDFASLLMAVEESFEMELGVQNDLEQAVSINSIAKLVEANNSAS